MRAKRTFLATIKEGKLDFADIASFRRHMWKFKDGDRVVVTAEKPRKKRSVPQNGYYWGVVLPVIAKETGHAPEEIHEVYKRMFLPRKIIKYAGKEYPLPGSTTECDTFDFTDFLERVRAHAASELGLTIPQPDQTHY